MARLSISSTVRTAERPISGPLVMRQQTHQRPRTGGDREVKQKMQFPASLTKSVRQQQHPLAATQAQQPVTSQAAPQGKRQAMAPAPTSIILSSGSNGRSVSSCDAIPWRLASASGGHKHPHGEGSAG